MRTHLKAVLTAAAVLAALAAGPTVYAESASAGSKEPARTTQSGQGGMMGNGGMMGMMNMMGQMSPMMDACTKMMQGMARQQAPEAPKDGKAPQKEG